MKLLYILFSAAAIILVVIALAIGLTYPMQALFFALVAGFFVLLGQGLVDAARGSGGKEMRAGS